MSEIVTNSIIYHFDVDSHSLPIGQFIDTAKATRDIIDTFNHEIFGNKLKFELHVMAVDPGGLLQSFVIGVVSASVFTGVVSVGDAVIDVKTGHDTSFWVKQWIQDIENQLQENPHSSTVTFELPPVLDAPTSGAQLDEKECRKIAQSVLAQLTTEFVKNTPGDLERTGFIKQKFKKAYEAKNKVYQACIDNLEVKALGFDRSYEFPVKQEKFAQHLTELPEGEPEKPGIVHMTLISPDGRKSGRAWLGSVEGQERAIPFEMEDPVFWKLIKSKKLDSHLGGDQMRVQWVYQEDDQKPGRIKKARVLRVLEFNGKVHAKRLSDDELKARLTNTPPSSEIDEHLGDLFENSDFHYTPDLDDVRSGFLSEADVDIDGKQQKQKVKLTDGS